MTDIDWELYIDCEIIHRHFKYRMIKRFTCCRRVPNNMQRTRYLRRDRGQWAGVEYIHISIILIADDDGMLYLYLYHNDNFDQIPCSWILKDIYFILRCNSI